METPVLVRLWDYEWFGFFFFAVLGIKPRVPHMVGKYSTTELHTSPIFTFLDE
jgi:hypothetical protein